MLIDFVLTSIKRLFRYGRQIILYIPLGYTVVFLPTVLGQRGTWIEVRSTTIAGCTTHNRQDYKSLFCVHCLRVLSRKRTQIMQILWGYKLAKPFKMFAIFLDIDNIM